MIRRAALFAALLCSFGGPFGAAAQTTDADWVVRSLIPQVLSVRTKDAPIVFDINAQNYPPEAFPNRYLSAPQTVEFFASVDRPWSVQIEVRDVVNAQGTRVLPAGRVYYRVDDGDWVQANGAPQVVHSQVGPTKGWLPVKVQFALELRGDETGGDFASSAVFTALVLP